MSGRLLPFEALCPACQVVHEWLQLEAMPAKDPVPQCPDPAAPTEPAA